MDIYLLHILLYSALGNIDIKIPKLLRHLFEKYENLDIDIFLNVFDLVCTTEGTMADSELLGMVNVHGDLQRMKVV